MAPFTRRAVRRRELELRLRPATALGPGNNCTGTVASGSPIHTTPAPTPSPSTARSTTTPARTKSHGHVHVRSAVRRPTRRAAVPASEVTLTPRVGSCRRGAPERDEERKSNAFKVVSYRFGLGGKKAALVTSKAGTVKLSLNGLSAGRHTLKVVITLRPTAEQRRGRH